MSITIAIIIITVLISLKAFQDPIAKAKLMFLPFYIKEEKQYYRFLSSGFIHADWIHLGFNMYVLYIFGNEIVEPYIFQSAFGEMQGKLVYIGFYLSAIIIAGLPSFIMHRNNRSYAALGASGAVSAVLFVYILVFPWTQLYVFFVPMPAIVFAGLYMAYSIYMAERGRDNIGHTTHIAGAVYGMIFLIIVEPDVWPNFIQQLLNPPF